MAKLSTAIMAAGKGTRMKSDLPKVLHPINNRPMVHYVIDLAEMLHSSRIVLIVGHQRELVQQTCAGRHVEFAVQDPQLGTGHAMMMTEELLGAENGEVLVLSGDVPLLTEATIRELVNGHEKSGAVATMLTSVLEDPTGYGRVVRNSKGHVVKIAEQKDATTEELAIHEINVGIYIFNIRELFAALKRINNKNAQGEYYLPDVLPVFIADGKTVVAVQTSNFDETRGINTIEQLHTAETILLNRR